MKKIFTVICYSLAVIFLVKIIVFEFSNPELTGTQQIIETWPQLICFIVSLISGTIFIEEWFK